MQFVNSVVKKFTKIFLNSHFSHLVNEFSIIPALLSKYQFCPPFLKLNLQRFLNLLNFKSNSIGKIMFLLFCEIILI